MEQYIRDANYILRNIAGSHVLISVGNNVANFNGYIQMNETAVFIWEKLEKPSTVEELAAAIEEEFDVAHDEAVADVIEFIQILKNNHMVAIHG